MIHIAIFLILLAGFVLLLLAMARHQQDWIRRKLSLRQNHALRLSGFALLIFAFAVAVSGLSWGYGAVAWFGWLTIAAGLVVTANSNRERLMRKVRRCRD